MIRFLHTSDWQRRMPATFSRKEFKSGDSDFRPKAEGAGTTGNSPVPLLVPYGAFYLRRPWRVRPHDGGG